MELLVIWLLFGVVSATIASNKGRSGCGWFLLGVLLGPFGLILAFVVSPGQDERNLPDLLRRCPACRGKVSREALACPHCGHPTGQAMAASQPPSALAPEETDPRYASENIGWVIVAAVIFAAILVAVMIGSLAPHVP